MNTKIKLYLNKVLSNFTYDTNDEGCDMWKWMKEIRVLSTWENLRYIYPFCSGSLKHLSLAKMFTRQKYQNKYQNISRINLGNAILVGDNIS